MKLKYIFKLLFKSDMSALLGIMRDWRSVTRIHFIHAALEAGLLQTLNKPRNRDQLIDALQVKRPEFLDALLDVGLSIGELSLSGGVFKLKGKISRTVITENGDGLGGLIQAQATYYNSIYRHAAERMRGAPDGDYLEEIGPMVARFSKLAEPMMRSFIGDLVKGKKRMRILEVGCGSGLLLRTAIEANTKATGVGVDLDPAVVEEAVANVDRWGLNDRIAILAGDVRDQAVVEQGPFDLITLYNVIYYFPFEQRPELLRTLRSMLAPGGRVALANGFQGHGKDPSAASLNLANCSIEGLTPLPDTDELTGQLKESGFGQVSLTKLLPGSSFIGMVAG